MPAASKRPQRTGLTMLIVVVAGITIAICWRTYKERSRPCEYQTADQLMQKYPTLKNIWEQKIAYMDTREAAEKILSAKLELAVKRGNLSDEKSFDIENRMFEQTMKGLEHFEGEFTLECQRVTGTK